MESQKIIDLYVMDFTLGNIFKYPVPSALEIDEIEGIISRKGHRLKDCEFMFGENIKIVKAD